MGSLFTELPPHLYEVDVIIAGGGTAGCVVAARLSDADPNLSILIIERGKNNYHDPAVFNPIFFLSHLAPPSNAAVYYKTSAESQLGGREMQIASGGILGGGSSINVTMYSRALRVDFDSWNTPGWSADDMLPYLKRLETYLGSGSPDIHGDSGPVVVSRGSYRASRPEDDFIEAAAKLGWPEVPDLQDLETGNAVERGLRTSTLDGIRQDAARAYVHPRLEDGKHANFTVLVENEVRRILFDDSNKAVGVEFHANPSHREAGSATPLRTVRARKAVVLSSGAFGTPLILERSGVGDPTVLQRVGVNMVSDVPGVGDGYQDHHLVSSGFKMDLHPRETADVLFDGRTDIAEMTRSGDAILGWNTVDVAAKVRPTPDDVAAFSPALREAWDRDYKDNPSKPLAIVLTLNILLSAPLLGLEKREYISGIHFTLYPYSRGHIHITGPDTADLPDFRSGFFSDPGDVDIQIAAWAYKRQREIFRRMRSFRGEVPEAHPPFAPGSDAAPTQGSPTSDVRDIIYSPEDDAVIETWLRSRVSTTWHSLGTCKMAPREQRGVVNPSLGVYGVEGLKIADLSIAPKNVGANTCNTAYAIGEKAAEIFIKELVG